MPCTHDILEMDNATSDGMCPICLAAENARLLAALKECSDDLAAEIEARFDAVKRHPAMAAKYRRDMSPVIEARKLIDHEQGAVNIPFTRTPQCACDPGTGIAPPPCTCGSRS